MNEKPRLRKFGGCWYCGSREKTGWGQTPFVAWTLWFAFGNYRERPSYLRALLSNPSANAS